MSSAEESRFFPDKQIAGKSTRNDCDWKYDRSGFDSMNRLPSSSNAFVQCLPGMQERLYESIMASSGLSIRKAVQVPGGVELLGECGLFVWGDQMESYSCMLM